MSGGSSKINTSSPALGALRVQQSSYGLTVPVVYGQTRISGNLGWYGDFEAVAHTNESESGGKGGGGVTQTETTYTYYAAVLMVLAEGQVNTNQPVKVVWRGKERYGTLNGETPLDQLGLGYRTGFLAQPVWSYLTTNHPTEALTYSGYHYVYGPRYQLSDNAEVHNHNFEIAGKKQIGGGILDADMAEVIEDLLPSDQYGCAFPAASIGDFSWFSNYIYALGLFMSPALTEQREAREWVAQWCRLLNSEPVWSDGKLKIIPYGDSAATGNGKTFAPDTTPQYDLTFDDFVTQSPDEEPVKIKRKSPADSYNKIIIEYVDRDNQYNVATAEASDLRAIELYGERAKDLIQAHEITDGGVATLVAQLILQRELYIRNTYSFRLAWRYSRLEPMDLVTLTDDVILDHLPVRIIKVKDTADGFLDIEAEDWPLGIASATKYKHEKGSGFAHEYNEEPGGVVTPIFFEGPVTRSTTGLEIYAAVSGSQANWGGCHIWTSLDGETYKLAGTVNGGSRYGDLTALMGTGPGATASVHLRGQGGQLLSGSQEDLDSLATLCWVGNLDGGEYFAYKDATLTGANAYNLTNLSRDAFNTGDLSHASGQYFVRVDQAIAKSGALEQDMIGKPIFFKFTSFNIYGGGEQSLVDVTEYQYYINGYMLKLPPVDVQGAGYRTEKFGVTVYWAPNPEPDVHKYHVKIDGTGWADADEWGYVGGTSFPWEVILTGGRNVWIKAVDDFGNESDNAALVVVDIAIPGTDLLTVGIIGPDAILKWVGIDGAFALDYYELRFGSTWAGATYITRSYTTEYKERITYTGLRRYWVAAVDVAGNVGAPVSVDLTVVSPSEVMSKRAEVIDNNVLLYWVAPQFGNLPVDHYDVRKGADWLTAQVVGSNGNSTFTVIFEQQSGTYKYWIAAVDTAGNIGTPSSIEATVNQPPDYILRSNIDDDFSGTKTNMYLENGSLLGPFTPVQWGTHFSAQGWTDIADQVAAGYTLFAEPSATSGSYEQQIDYGASVPATQVTITLSSNIIDGSVAVSCQVSYKLLVGDPWTDAVAGFSPFITANFRYLRVTLSFSCTAGANLIKCSGLNIKLANKLKTDAGGGTANSGDSGGTTVNFNIAFVDVTSIIATPRGTQARFAVVDFVDVPNPTSFKVLLFNTSGTRVSGDFDWTARGY